MVGHCSPFEQIPRRCETARIDAKERRPQVDQRFRGFVWTVELGDALVRLSRLLAPADLLKRVAGAS
jgi:hypothetical protein